MWHLIYINILIIVLDLVLLGTEYAGLFYIQTTLKCAVYSIKLKLEFTILNQLLEYSQLTLQSNANRILTNEFVNQSNYQPAIGGSRTARDVKGEEAFVSPGHSMVQESAVNSNSNSDVNENETL